MWRLAIFVLAMPSAGSADYLSVARTIRAQDIVGAADLVLRSGEMAGALQDPDQVVGQEARVVLYAGRPIRPGDVGPPALIERNQIVPLIYSQSGVTIATEGRSLDRAAAGEFVRAMNLTSRTTVSGQVQPDSSIHVNR